MSLGFLYNFDATSRFIPKADQPLQKNAIGKM